MRATDLARLVALAAIRGTSFVFLRGLAGNGPHACSPSSSGCPIRGFRRQADPATPPEAFDRALAWQKRTQARRDRKLALPGFPVGPPIAALRDWPGVRERSANVERTPLAAHARSSTGRMAGAYLTRWIAGYGDP